MVTIDRLTKEELTSIIAEDLRIDVAFPCFSPEEGTGATACCVVHKNWLATLKRARVGERISLKRYSTDDTSKNLEQTNEDRQAPTSNVLVSVLLKHVSPEKKRPQLYGKKEENEDRFMKYNSFDELEVPIRTFIKEQLQDVPGPHLWELEANYEYYYPLLSNDYHQSNADDSKIAEDELTRQKLFVEKFLAILYPESAYFRISRSENTDVSISLELLSQSCVRADKPISNPNLIDIFAVIESEKAYYFMAPYRGTTLGDLLNFSSGVLKSNIKKSFIVFQLLRAIKGLHELGVVHGGIKPSNIMVDENLWITLTGFECFAPFASVSGISDKIKKRAVLGIPREIADESFTVKWVRGEISNFSYLMSLNHLAGRRIGDPNFHPIFPWITDFTGANPSQNWRDFTKTKFRLNKGDEQLDFTFDGPVPHHITDILSDITYYVYLARKTPIPVLCQYVRTKYEPNEYPSSLQRLFEWTPDECIPEFYTDSSIFKSIHPDMPDLQLPGWGSTPEEFIRIHSAALESDFVSSQLHKWIDLTFGCKLSGDDAVEAKNVALPLLDGQDSFMKHGITQLFNDEHPQRSFNWNQAKRNFTSQITDDKTSLEKFNILNSKRRISQRTTIMDKSGLSKLSEKKNSDLLIFDIPAAEKIIAKPSGTISRNKKQVITAKPLSLYDFGNANLGRERDFITTTMADPKDPLGRIESLATLMNSIPIELPDEMNSDIFTKELKHFEQAHSFGVKYKHLKSSHYHPDHGGLNVDSENSNFVSKQSFAYARAWDAYCLGKIFDDIYCSGKKITPSEMTVSHFRTNGSDFQRGISKAPLAVDGVIDALSSPEWIERPSIDAILYTSTPATSLRDYTTTLPIPECISEVYDFLTRFYAAHSKDRLKLVKESIEKICHLNDEAFNLILPSLVSLYSYDSVKTQALNLFPMLGQRLGEEETKNHLLKPIVSLFESSRPSIPKILFNWGIIEQFLRRFGITNFLQQIFPLYLDALTVDEKIIATVIPDVESDLKYIIDAQLTSSPISVSSRFSFDTTSIPTVTALANSALVDICSLVGPILTSKYIMKQVYKLLLKEYSSLNLLLQSIATIGQQFGETFTYLQYSHAISVIQTSSSSADSRNTIILNNHLALLEKLTSQISSNKLFTEFESGLADAFIKILEWREIDKTTRPTDTTHNLKNKLSVHLKIINYLLQISNNGSKEDWERHIAPILQKYFSSFGMSPENLEQINLANGSGDLEEERDRQMVYAYSQFSNLVGQESMRRVVLISDAIESLMEDQLSSSNTPPIRVTPPLSIEYSLNGHSPDDSQSSISSGGGRDLSINKGHSGDDKSLLAKHGKESTITGLSLNRAFSLFGNDGIRKSPDIMNGKRFPRSMTIGAGSVSPPTAEKSRLKSLHLTWRTKSTAQEDLRNWNRYLSTNSEEMSNKMQFTFNDLKLRTYLGHASAVRGIGINENSRIIASGSRDRTVKLWSLDIHHGIENSATEPYSQCLTTYSGHRKAGVGDVYFVGAGGSSGLVDVVASCDGFIHLWHPETGQTLHQFGNNRTPFVSIRPMFRSRYILGGLSDNTLTFLDTVNHSSLHKWKCSTGFSGSIRAISVNNSETLIAVGYSSGMISLIDSRTGMIVGSWKAGDTDIIHLKFYSSGYLISCAPADHVICIWDTDTMSLIKTIRVSSDIVALNMYKDELITINNSNTIAFTPLNENLYAYSSKFRSSTIKSSITSLGILPINQLLVIGCMEELLYNTQKT
ncbi:hypothetical protein G9A89_016090 [Geosiphon pyriformis]|nr:hypothetical protein G9A89_016090 [Geosiphon pyriformis]